MWLDQLCVYQKGESSQLRRDTPVSPTLPIRQLGSFSLRDHHFIRTSCHMLVSRDGPENELPYSLGQCFSTFFASRPKMSDCNLSATPAS